ncbi:MAG: hypothetical protein A2234_08900 [Elusimicrobia bacterium RIFOXYA2_FULL_58_8]|nr:MAG: hypothetical protein A2285_01685 [Elusimicrobia bacterium RIFOXYA12_FULL_57_11]OGS15082.1 MAG: hypothetical protein A2234_08900 [Elusimicrobia bacterium RIFOXYA2_FULL_58_8]
MTIKKIMFIKPGEGIVSPNHGIPSRYEPPLGLLYLISALRRNFPDKFETDLFENNISGCDAAQVRARIAGFGPDIVCLACMSVERKEAAAIAKIVKELNPRCLVILGGPHPSMFYARVLEDANIDIAVIGEGEATFVELTEKLLAGEPLWQVNGLALRKDGRAILTPPREPVENLDKLPFPAWDLVDFKKYSNVKMSMNIITHSVPWAAIFTSRGCPFHCAYCHNIFGKMTRFRSPENVVEEIELLAGKYGVKEIHIIDDIFNFDLVRAKKICDLIIARGLRIKIAFPNGIRGDMMDRELIRKLKRAGCYSIYYAIETASPRLQKVIHKNLDLEKVRQAIAWTRAENILPRGYFMMGFPGETPEEIETTVRWALDSELLMSLFLTVVIYPGIELERLAREAYPGFDFSDWDKFEFHYYADSPVWTQATGIDLSRIRALAYRRFYYRAKIIFPLLYWLPMNHSSLRIVRGFFYGLFAAVTRKLAA